MASTAAAHQNEGPVASRLRSRSKLLKQQNEGPIASRLRPQSKVGNVQTSHTEHTGGTHVNNSSGKPSQLSRHQRDKNDNSVAKKGEAHTASTKRAVQPSEEKGTKKSNDSTPKSSEGDISSSCTSLPSNDKDTKIIKDSNDAKRKQDLKNQHAKSDRTNQNSKNQKPRKMVHSAAKKSNNPKPSSSNDQKKQKKTQPWQKLAMDSITEHTTYHIRWKGFDTATCWNCSLCEKDLACLPIKEEWEHSIQEEYELEHSFSSRMGLELEQYSLLPEVSVLPCSHVFHSMCLCVAAVQLSDPPCPICVTVL